MSARGRPKYIRCGLAQSASCSESQHVVYDSWVETTHGVYVAGVALRRGRSARNVQPAEPDGEDAVRSVALRDELEDEVVEGECCC